jgi:hypothetical protein
MNLIPSSLQMSNFISYPLSTRLRGERVRVNAVELREKDLVKKQQRFDIMNIIVENVISSWYNIMYGKFKKILSHSSLFSIKGDPYGIKLDFRNHANLLIIAKNLLILSQNLSIQPRNNQTQILVASVSLLSLNSLLLFFISALAAKVPAWTQNRAYFLRMPAAVVYGPKIQRYIAVLLPRHAPKYHGPCFRTSWVML